jgi:molybdopterin molybdotransferase
MDSYTIAMISFEKASEILQHITLPVSTERIDTRQALNRILAEDIRSDMNIPPFDKSAMDGYACRKADLKNALEVIEEIPAGSVPEKTVGPNQCSRIMTGGMVPPGADYVFLIEHTGKAGANSVKCLKETIGSNICHTGEDISIGETVLPAGEIIKPQHMAILASAGITRTVVYAIHSIAVISTGNELVEPDEAPGISKIRNSNAWQLMAQASILGYHPDYLGIVPDDENLLLEKLAASLDQYNIILISGGVSVGDYDYVPAVLKKLGVSIDFHGLEARPGKHLLFGRKNNCIVFGLPGNPVSSFIQFEVLIKPLLLKLRGFTEKTQVKTMPMEVDYQRKNADTLSFIPGITTAGGTVLPLEYHGSAHIHSYVNADCIIEIPMNINLYKKGSLVNVRPL